MKTNKLLLLSSLAVLGLVSCGGNLSSSIEESEESSLTSEEESPRQSEESASSIDETVYYTVTFDLNGGRLATGENYVEPQKVAEGHWARKPASDPVKANCTFIGWYADGFPFNFMTAIYGDVNLRAEFEVNEESKVTLHINPNNGEKRYDIETFLGDTVSLTTPTAPEGMAFRGWYLDGDIDSPFTGMVTSLVVAANEIIALYEKSTFKLLYTLDEEGNATITGLYDINATYITVPAYIGTHPVTRISNSAFNSRIYLTDVNLPSTVKEVSGQAFAGARALQRINVDANSPYFKDIDGVLYSKDERTLVCCPQKNSDGSTFVIPSQVKTIGEYAFYNQNEYYGGIHGVKFSEGLEEIGKRAFYNVCYSATDLTFPSTLKKIGESAFCQLMEGSTQINFKLNEGLEEIGEDAFIGIYIKGALSIPSTVKKIGDYAFCCPQSSNNAITSVALPEALEEFGIGVFYNCFGIEEFTISARNDHFTKINKSLYSKDAKKLYWVPSDAFKDVDYIMEASTEEIMPRSMGELRYTNGITLNEGLKRIDDEAFHGSYYLTSIVIPDSVTYLGASAFEYAEKLSSVTIGAGVSEIGEYCFADSGLRSVDIPATVKRIGDDAFFGAALSSLTLHEGLEEIGYRAFYHYESSGYEDYRAPSSSLASLSFPNSLKKIGGAAFAGQSNLTSIRFGKSLEEIGYKAFEASVSNVEATPEAIAAGASVSSYTFYSVNKKALYCSPIYNGKIEIKEGTLEIGESAFAKVKASGITFPSTLTKIGEGAFESAFNSSEEVILNFPASLKTIAEGAFYFANVDGVTFKEGLEEIGQAAFGFNDIPTLSFPNSLKSIGIDAFGACSSLTEVSFGNGLEAIEDEAFWGDGKIASVTLPASLRSFGAGVFGGYGYYTYALSSIDVDPANPNYASENGAIYNKDKTVLLEVAPGATGAFKVNDATTEIGTYAFSHCTGLTSISFPETLQRVGDYAFSQVDGVASFRFTAALAYVGNRAFERTTSAQTVTFACTLVDAIASFHSDYRGGGSCKFVYLGGE